MRVFGWSRFFLLDDKAVSSVFLLYPFCLRIRASEPETQRRAGILVTWEREKYITDASWKHKGLKCISPFGKRMEIVLLSFSYFLWGLTILYCLCNAFTKQTLAELKLVDDKLVTSQLPGDILASCFLSVAVPVF